MGILSGRKVFGRCVATNNEKLVFGVVEKATDPLVARAAYIDGKEVIVASRHVDVLSVDRLEPSKGSSIHRYQSKNSREANQQLLNARNSAIKHINYKLSSPPKYLTPNSN